MKILVVGGGSGGHVTPVIAVSSEIIKKHPRAKLSFWTDSKYYKNAKEAVAAQGLQMPVKRLCSGKLRRYTNFGFWDYICHFGMVLSNIFDGFKLIIGIWQSFWRLLLSRPNVIFLKGGYVCLPVGIAAHWLKIPYVIHDSDAAPGLTNRILAKHATKIATGMPLDFYKYPEGRAIWTGIPISGDFKPVSSTEQSKLKKELGFDKDKKLVVVTGGSLGARHINEATVKILPELLKKSSVVLISGQTDYEALKKDNAELLENKDFQLLSFTNEIVKYFGAADVVVSRAGASTLSELSSMKKAVVLVPNHKLPGFHQVKNAENYEKSNAALLVADAEEGVDESKLFDAIFKFLENDKLREEYGKNLAKFAKNDAAKELAEIVLAEAR